MYRIDNADATSTLPTPLPPGPVARGFFQSGNPAVGQKATIVDRDWANATQEEICAVIEAAGITLAKTNNAQLLAALRKLFLARTVITADTTIFVDPVNGNDANAGLAPGAAAFATIQAAINSMYYWYDWDGHTGTIQLADGTYNYNVAGGSAGVFAGMPFGMRPGNLRLTGNIASPGNVIINATYANGLEVVSAYMILRGVTITASGAVNTPYEQRGNGLTLNIASYCDVANCTLGSCGQSQIACANASQIAMSGSGMTFTGTTQFPIWASQGGTIWMPSTAINVTGLAHTYFAACDSSASITAIGATFAGTATGTRYSASNNGTINVGGAGPNFFPGSIAGIVSSGGQYN